MSEKSNDNILSSELYTTEASESKKRSEAEKNVPDPSEDEIEEFLKVKSNDNK